MKQNRISWKHMLSLATLSLVASYANATYTVVSDDLMPSKQITPAAQHTSVPVTALKHYNVAFPKFYTSLSENAKRDLDKVIPTLAGATKIRISGKSDEMQYADKQLQDLGTRRSFAIRGYLIAKGVPSAIITLESNNTGVNPKVDGLFLSDIDIDSPVQPTANDGYTQAVANNAQIVQSYTGNIDTTTRYQTSPQTATYDAPVATAPQAGSSDQLITYINNAVMQGKMSPSVAVQLLSAASAMPQPTFQQSMQPAPAAQLQYASTPPQQQNPFSIKQITEWQLDKSLTLRQNVDAWLKIAGWNPSNWEASNFFQVSSDNVVYGAFPTVLSQISDATGLNFCVSFRAKTVRVTDSSVPCK